MLRRLRLLFLSVRADECHFYERRRLELWLPRDKEEGLHGNYATSSQITYLVFRPYICVGIAKRESRYFKGTCDPYLNMHVESFYRTKQMIEV